MTDLYFDAETNGLLDTVSKLWLVLIGDPETGEVVAYSDVDARCRPLAEGIARLHTATRLIGHNLLNYDLPAMKKLGVILPWTKVVDTLILSRMTDPSRPGGHSLGRWGELLKFPKGDFKEFETYSEKMLPYGIQDVELGLRVWARVKHLMDECPEAVATEHAFGWCMSLQMQNGFAFDTPRAEALLADLRQEVITIEHSLQDIFPPITNERYSDKTGKRLKDRIEVFNPGSRPQIAARLTTKYGWKPSKFTPSGQAQIDETVLEELVFPEAKAMVRYLNAEKKRSMLESWIKATKDGRIYGSINTIGANTHRCTHRAPNVAQADKDKRMRSLWIASPDLLLVGCDAEGLELRMLGHYLANWDGGEFSNAVVYGKKDDGSDVHSRNQKIARFYGREFAKTLIYALLYGAGDAKLGAIAVDDARAAGRWTAQLAPHLFNKKNGDPLAPSTIGKALRARLLVGIKGFDKLLKAVQGRVKRGYVLGLDGRKVQIRSAHSALNTLLQSAGAIVMKWAMLCFWEKWEDKHGEVFRFCVACHDEQQFECIPEAAESVGLAFSQAITEAGVRLKIRCPLSGSYSIGANWAETH